MRSASNHGLDVGTKEVWTNCRYAPLNSCGINTAAAALRGGNVTLIIFISAVTQLIPQVEPSGEKQTKTKHRNKQNKTTRSYKLKTPPKHHLFENRIAFCGRCNDCQ